MEVETIIKNIASPDLATSSCATYMAAMLLAQLGTREKDSPSPFATKLISSIHIHAILYLINNPFDLTQPRKICVSCLMHKIKETLIS